MIAKLRGTVDQIGDGFAIVDVGGVGYKVALASHALARLRPGEAATLWIETQVGEDRIRLFGFLDAAEQDWFRLLTTVQGVGAKTALSILSALPPDDLARAIAASDTTALSRADGVGGKLAARVAAELRDKAGAIALHAAARGGRSVRGGDGAAAGSVADAVSALANLGYAPSDALAAVARAADGQGADAPVEALIRAALAELSGAWRAGESPRAPEDASRTGRNNKKAAGGRR